MNAEAAQLLNKYPDRIPCIVKRSVNSSLPNIDKEKYLVPRNITMGQFMYIIRKRLKMSETVSLLLMSKMTNAMFPQEILMGQVYENHKDPDGYLYMVYTGENTFG